MVEYPWSEFPEDLSTWNRCIEEHTAIKRKAELWEDLKYILHYGKWADWSTICQVLTQMENIEEQLKYNQRN